MPKSDKSAASGGGGRTPEDESFSNNVKARREDRGWSQGELARRVSALGVEGFHQTTISRIEKGERPVRLGEAMALARVLDARVDHLMLAEGPYSVLSDALENLRLHRQGMRELYEALDSVIVARERLRSLVDPLDGVVESLTENRQLQLDAQQAQQRAKDIADRSLADELAHLIDSRAAELRRQMKTGTGRGTEVTERLQGASDGEHKEKA